jgi:mitochondrial fission protein ELM1
MAFFEKARILSRLVPSLGRDLTSGSRTQPECVALGVPEGVTPSSKPPVRIFVGTEPGQSRAERVFVWSVEQVRDVSRVYEIYLMKDLIGFDRRGWLTGFTNYRFAVPYFTGESGRAIYNDADQIYLADPGELYDTDLGGHGFLALSDRDTSVMLLDCARMAPVWRLEAARRELRKSMEARARAVPGLWGPLDPVWHARDAEYVPGSSKLIHYTTIHMQPWQPFPQRYAYQRNPVGRVWSELERTADAAGYQVFRAERPSAQYRALIDQLGTAAGGETAQRSSHRPPPQATPDALCELIAATEARTILDYGLGAGHDTSAGPAGLLGDQAGPAVTRASVVSWPLTERLAERFDGVVCTGMLAYLPDEDVPWVLDELFGYATRFVYVTMTQPPPGIMLPGGARLRPRLRDPSWWSERLAATSARHPSLHWRLLIRMRTKLGRQTAYSRQGGRCLTGTPAVWLLTDAHPGNTTQSVGLAQALGWPYTTKQLRFNALVGLHDALFGAFGTSRLGLDRRRSAALTPPWPDVVVATGWRTAHVARWIRRRSRGQTRLVQLGRGSGHVAEYFDAVVSCEYFRLPPHPRRIEIVAPLTQVTPDRLAQAAKRWRGIFENAPRPRIALLVGGASGLYRLDTATARRLGEEVGAFVRAAEGSAFVTTSPRTGPEATETLQSGLGDCWHLHRWQAGQQDNPYLGYLALADVLIVTGDSESMLAEAVATSKPVYIYALPGRTQSPRTWLREWVVQQAQKPRWNQRGTIRPQHGLSYLCGRLIERGVVLPPNDVNTFHETLIRAGMAQPFGAPLQTEPRPVWREIDAVARRVRTLIGIHGEPG